MMRIGELAEYCATTVETLRFYEREGLFEMPARSSGNYRLYDKRAVERIAFIRHCRALDMTLDEIRVLLRLNDSPDASCAEVNKVLDEHIGHVAARMAALRQLKRQLESLKNQCSGTSQVAQCAILSGLGKPEDWSAQGQSGHAHVPGVHRGPATQRKRARK